MVIVGEFVAAWAKRDAEAVAERLADDARWSLIGETTLTGTAGSKEAIPRIDAEHVEVLSIVTHGRLASCDGYLKAGSRRVAFSHVLRFASTAKSAKIAELRTYQTETS